jgi:predicted enzyme related to lactoylglutathione lyase
MHHHHRIDYIEFPVPDMAAAKRFYAAAFGWKFTDYGPAYAGIQAVDREAGGMYESTSTQPGGPLVILYSRDLEQSLAAVRAAGGVIVKEPFGFPGGRRFEFTDPGGQRLGVWSET